MHAKSDRELLELFAIPESRNAAFTLLVKQYQQKLYWHIRRMVLSHEDADDLLQNTFLKAYRALDQFREEAKLSTWLYRIATNECISFLNQQKKRFADTEALKAELTRQASEAYPLIGANQIEKKLQEAILHLPQKQKQVFHMKYFDRLRYEDMAEILGTSIGALKASYHLAVKKIEAYINSSEKLL